MLGVHVGVPEQALDWLNICIPGMGRGKVAGFKLGMGISSSPSDSCWVVAANLLKYTHQIMQMCWYVHRLVIWHQAYNLCIRIDRTHVPVYSLLYLMENGTV